MFGTNVPPNWPTISVVIPTYNRAKLLKECLVSLCALSYPQTRFEVIVVDDGSRDDTQSVLEQFKHTADFEFTYLQQDNRGPATARNQGVYRASGSLVAFTDDDCIVDPNWLIELTKGFTTQDIAGVGGTIRTRSTGLVPDYMVMHKLHSSRLEGDGAPVYLTSGNACYRKNVLVEVGGFDEKITQAGGEDPDLSWRVVEFGYTLAVNPAAIVYHHEGTSLRHFADAFYRYGRGYKYTSAKHSMDGSGPGREQLLKALSLRYFGYRARQYLMVHRLGLRRALCFAFLDHVRDIAFLAGYWSLRVLGMGKGNDQC